MASSDDGKSVMKLSTAVITCKHARGCQSMIQVGMLSHLPQCNVGEAAQIVHLAAPGDLETTTSSHCKLCTVAAWTMSCKDNTFFILVAIADL